MKGKSYRVILVCLVASHLTAAMFISSGCTGNSPDQQVILTAEVPLHLEEHLDAARIIDSEVPSDLPAPVEWKFNESLSGWQAIGPFEQKYEPIVLEHDQDALKVVLTEANRNDRGGLSGFVYTELPDLNLKDWIYIQIRARTKDSTGSTGVGFNLRTGPRSSQLSGAVSRYRGENVPMIADGQEHTYLLRADEPWSEMQEPWKQLIIWCSSRDPATIDILSVRLIPKSALYSVSSAGIQNEDRNNIHRRTIFTHSPGRLEYKVRLPKSARLDFGIGVLDERESVTFLVKTKELQGDKTTHFEESYANTEEWLQKSIDLSSLAGKTVTLSLETYSEQKGAVALWASPTITGEKKTTKPNIIFYVIDGAGADYLSLYGYNRHTTPNLEKLAAEGAVFTRAYSNSTWTKISTPSFMTSLHNSVLGGYRNDTDPLPDQVVTMAEHMHRAGYQTAVFTTNAYCGKMSSLDRGVDTMREIYTEPNSKSSYELHQDFWNWRESYPGEPYWVHFQTTDVHWPYHPPAPFAGLYISEERREAYYRWEKLLAKASGLTIPGWPTEYSQQAFDETGISHKAFYNSVRDLYDEMMAHNDYQIGKLIRRLKALGEWKNTVFILAADHGSEHGNKLLDSSSRWTPRISSPKTKIPLIIVWPGHIKPGQQFDDPVSMIDMLPTVLELAQLPATEVMQGNSLTPLLLGDREWRPEPVIVDEFYYKEDGEIFGTLELVNERWGAVLLINPRENWQDRPPESRVPSMLSLYDLWNDPNCLFSLHEKYPELVVKYTAFLKKRWREHLNLAKRFSRSDSTALDSDQLQALRNLGYIQ